MITLSASLTDASKRQDLRKNFDTKPRSWSQKRLWNDFDDWVDVGSTFLRQTSCAVIFFALCLCEKIVRNWFECNASCIEVELLWKPRRLWIDIWFIKKGKWYRCSKLLTTRYKRCNGSRSWRLPVAHWSDLLERNDRNKKRPYLPFEFQRIRLSYDLLISLWAKLNKFYLLSHPNAICWGFQIYDESTIVKKSSLLISRMSRNQDIFTL